MKIAILGAHGFVGRNLCRLLSSRGHVVTGYVLNPKLGLSIGFESKSVYELFNSQIGAGPSYDVTINLAARRSTSVQPFSDSQVNEFTFEIPKEFILRTAGPDTLVLNSSTYIQNFGGIAGHTVDSYGASKEKLSRFLEEESSHHKFKTLDLYFFTLYGEGDRPNHLVPLLLNAAFTGKKISLSPGNQLMNLLHIDDVIDAYLIAAKRLIEDNVVQHELYAVSSGNPIPLKELVKFYATTTGKNIKVNWGARPYRFREVMNTWNLGVPIQDWGPKISLENGVKGSN